jgi:hypothetical protein
MKMAALEMARRLQGGFDMSTKSRRMKKLAGVVALAAGFAVTALHPSATLAELCGGGKESGNCTSGSMGGGNTGGHDDGAFSPPSS